MKKSLSFLVPAALACFAPAAFASTAAPPASINGFSDPGGFTLNANSGGFDGQDAAAHGVPAISGGTLHLTTTQGVTDTQFNTFFGSENTSTYANGKQYIGQFYASFVYHYNGTNPASFGPGNGFAFILQNDPRGLHALGTTGYGNGQQGDPNTVSPSAAVEFGLFTGFGQARGTQLAFNGDPGTGGIFRVPGAINLISGDPISVVLTYDGATLTETLTDTVTEAAYTTAYPADLPTAVGSAYAYVGFTGGTGAAVSDQTITDFLFTSAVPPPVNTGPKIVVSASASAPNAAGQTLITVSTGNLGAATADKLQITSVTLLGVGPLPAPISPSPVPTTPDLLAPNHTQTNGFDFTPQPGTTSAVFKVSGTYIDTSTGKPGSFTTTVRSLPLPQH